MREENVDLNVLNSNLEIFVKTLYKNNCQEKKIPRAKKMITK